MRDVFHTLGCPLSNGRAENLGAVKSSLLYREDEWEQEAIDRFQETERS